MCVRACVCAYVRACVRACMRAYLSAHHSSTHLPRSYSRSSKHWLWKWLSESVHGKFPFHDARFLPTEAQVEAMFREGVRAMSAEAVQTFVNDLPKTDKGVLIQCMHANVCG